MDIELACLQFANLLEMAKLSAVDNDIFKRQEALVEIFRERKLPFMATMVVRSQFRCNQCRTSNVDGIRQFENPAVPARAERTRSYWGTPSGICFAIKTGKLHDILAHNATPPTQFMQVLESVNL